MRLTIAVPVSVAASPNQIFICSTSPSAVQGLRTSVHTSPHRRSPSTALQSLRNDLTRALLSAIYSRRSPSDVIHVLSAPSMQMDAVALVLYEALSVLEANTYGLLHLWHQDFLGVATEVYLFVFSRRCITIFADALLQCKISERGARGSEEFIDRAVEDST